MARLLTDVDPRRMTVDPQPKRRRQRLRNRPDPLASVKSKEGETVARQMKRAASPGVMLEPTRKGWRCTSPHNDLTLWDLQISDAFGTRSVSVVNVFLKDLKRLARQWWDEDTQRWKADETELNAALAMVADVKPRNSIEAALAAQMVAVHWMQMRVSRDALNRGGMVMEKDAIIASKLARTFTMQLEALRGIKGRKRSTSQKITVRKETHQHVHYHDHRGDEENDPQSQGRTDPQVADIRPALPSPDEGGRVVPMPRRARTA